MYGMMFFVGMFTGVIIFGLICGLFVNEQFGCFEILQVKFFVYLFVAFGLFALGYMAGNSFNVV